LITYKLICLLLLCCAVLAELVLGLPTDTLPVIGAVAVLVVVSRGIKHRLLLDSTTLSALVL
jgi:hypothetical protein